MISEVLLLIKQICSTRSEIYDLWTSISILLQPRTFKTVECVRYAFSAAYYTLVLVISKAAFVTDPYEGCRSDVGIADRAFTIAFVAQTSDSNTCLLAAHNEIGMMARHCVSIGSQKL